jgi:hypothetical protein
VRARSHLLSDAAAGVVTVGLGAVGLAPATAQSTARQPDVMCGLLLL